MTLKVWDGKQKSTGIFALAPFKSERLRHLVPSTLQGADAVVLTHAGALAMKTLGVATSGCAFLQFAIQLNEVDRSILRKQSLGKPVIPGHRRLPAVEFGIPLWLMTLITSQPSVIVSAKGQTH